MDFHHLFAAHTFTMSKLLTLVWLSPTRSYVENVKATFVQNRRITMPSGAPGRWDPRIYPTYLQLFVVSQVQQSATLVKHNPLGQVGVLRKGISTRPRA